MKLFAVSKYYVTFTTQSHSNNYNMETLGIAKNKIENGAKFNGVVYNKFNGKNWVTFSIYLDGTYFKICEVQKTHFNETKKEIELALFIFPICSTSLPKNDLPNTVSSFATTTCDVEKAKVLNDFHSFCEGQD